MGKKVLLIVADGMRPDALAQCGRPFAAKLAENSLYTYAASSVMPSVTLPCHMTMFHGVTPERHGILSNTYVPQVRPVKGLCETLKAAGKTSAMLYSWEELRDLSRPGYVLSYAEFVSGNPRGYGYSNEKLTERAIDILRGDDAPDFTFLYFGSPDAAGHGHGWMSESYLEAVAHSVDCTERVISWLGDDFTVIFTSDHGGHNRSHGTDMPEDMVIPMFIFNRAFAGRELEGGASLVDIAPTVAGILGVEPDPEWEGRNLLA